MFIGSGKFISSGRFASSTAVGSIGGSTASGISLNDGTFPCGGFSGTDTSAHIDSVESNLNFPSVSYLGQGRILTVDMTAFETTYKTFNFAEPNRQCQVILAYANAGNTSTSQFGFGTTEVIATVTSMVSATSTELSGVFTHTNNYSSYRINFGTGDSGTLSAYPIRFFTKRLILTADKTNTFGAGTVGTGLIGRYQVSAGGQAVSGGVSITIREG